MYPINTNTAESGFTLLELLLAVSILAIISAAAYQLLTNSTSAITYVRSMHTDIGDLRELQWRLRRDINAIVRPVYAAPEKSTGPIQIQSDQETRLAISPTQNTSFFYSTQSEVTYIWSKEKSSHTTATLLRSSTFDSSNSTTEQEELLVDISGFSITVSDSSGKTLTHWPPTSTEKTRNSGDRSSVNSAIPTLIDVVVTSERLGTIPITVGVW